MQLLHVVNMLQFAVCVFVCVFAVVGADDKLISKGNWRIIVIEQCEEPEKYKMDFNVTKYKISRLEDAFDAAVSLPNGIDETYSLEAPVDKYTDGGWKSYQVVNDNCFLCFVKKYAQDNFQRLKHEMGVDTDEDKIPKGEYIIKRFKVDYCELPPDGILGTFKAKALVFNPLKEPEACVIITLEFREELDKCGEEEAD